MAKVHKVYETEFKKMIVRLVLEEGRTIKSVNEEYSLGEGTVRSFIKRFEEECASDYSKKTKSKMVYRFYLSVFIGWNQTLQLQHYRLV